MIRTLAPALLAGLVACTGPSTEPSPDKDPPTFAEVKASPDAAAADPSLPVSATFAQTNCEGCPKCDLDVGSLAAHVGIAPSPKGTVLVRLDPATCALHLGIVGGLARDSDYAVTLGPGFRDVWGNVSTETKQIALHTAKTAAGDTPPPRFLGSWPADGDARLAADVPVTLFYDRPVLAETAVVTGVSDVLVEEDPQHQSLVLRPKTEWPKGAVALTVSGVTSLTRTPSEADAVVHLTRADSDDRQPPTFLGAQVPSAPSSVGTSIVHWDPAEDDLSKASEIRYLVYVAGAGRSVDFTVPTFVTEPGATTIEIAVPVPPMRVAVRAQDAAGNTDLNQIVQVQP